MKVLNRDMVEAQTGYRPFTTFFEDFSMADRFGVGAIRDTYDRAFNEWKGDYKYLTEFVMILNWEIWEHYENNETYAYALENLKGEELQYFCDTTERKE